MSYSASFNPNHKQTAGKVSRGDRKSRCLGLIGFGLVALAILPSALAQNVWTGAAGVNQISDSGNWFGDSAPNFAAGNQTLEFGLSENNFILIDLGVNISGLVFSSQASYMFQLDQASSGSLLVGSGGISANGGDAMTNIDIEQLELSAAQTWNIDNNAMLTFNYGFGGEFTVSKNGSGTVVLPYASTRTSVSTGTILNSGTIELQNSNSLSTSAEAPLQLNGGNLRLANDAPTNFSGTNITVSANSTIITAPFNDGDPFPTHTVGDLRIGTQSLTIEKDAGIGGAILKTGLVFLNGNPTFDISGEDLSLHLGAVAETSGTHGIVKNGMGTLSLTGNSTFTGATTINSGTLEVAAGGRLGGGNYSANIFNAGSFVFSGNSSQTLSGAVSGNGTMVHNGAGTLLLGGNNTFTGSLSIGPAIFEIAPTGRLGGGNFSANISNGGTLVNASNFSQTLSGFLAGNGGLTQNGSSTLLLTRNNTYTGATTIHSGTISVPLFPNAGVAGPLGNSTNSASNLVFSGGTLLYTGANASTDRNFTLANGATSTIGVGNSSSTLTMSGSSAATTGSLSKTGNGTLVLNGNANHSGGTTVSSGTLRINGNHNGAVSVEAGASLGGGGSIDSLATLNAGASLQPGNTVGTMTFNGGLLLHNGSNTTMEINSDATYDRISVTGGNITYGGQLNLVFGFTPATPTTFNLFDGIQVGDSSFSAITFSGPVDSTGYGFNYATGELTVVPEPAPLALLGLSTIILLWLLNGKKRETV